MSRYDNVVVGKLRLKGKALDVKNGGITKKKKHKKHYYDQLFAGENPLSDLMKELNTYSNSNEGNDEVLKYEDRLTPAERRYLKQWQQLEVKRLLKSACESHRDRIKKFNHYLASLSEHYDIPKVGPG